MAWKFRCCFDGLPPGGGSIPGSCSDELHRVPETSEFQPETTWVWRKNMGELWVKFTFYVKSDGRNEPTLMVKIMFIIQMPIDSEKIHQSWTKPIG